MINNKELNQDPQKNSFIQKDFEFPLDLKDFTKEECAKILRKALTASEKFNTQSELAQVTKINLKTIGDYFCARHKPPQEKWNLLRKVLYPEIQDILHESNIKLPQLIDARHSIEKLKAIIFLLKDELEFFKESSPEVREILKEYIPGYSVGYITSLLTALYDENQLIIFKNFTKE